MSAEDEQQPRRADRDETSPLSDDSSSDSDSSAGSNDGGSGSPKIEWLATGRAKRSTAGNRMKSMLANEEPDSDLELLFAEDENDAGFEDVGDDASDVQMDSSSDDEDEQNAGDDLEGEKELERQAREKRTAARKRKAQEAIPAKFRKKVRVQPTGPVAAPAPAPRPKKKSERHSWLPSPADAPTRASERQTTRMSKEQLHQQMKEREARRLKQLAIMEKKQKKLEAMKKPPMTQEERLAEAAIVEKRNAKSLNRWEEAEKQREEERKAKLAALNSRTLKGPVITFWSGRREWNDDRLKQGGIYHIEVEEKPRKKRLTAAEKEKEKEKAKEKGKLKDKDGDTAMSTAPPTPVSATAPTALGAAGPQAGSTSGVTTPKAAEPAKTAVKPEAESKDNAALPEPPVGTSSSLAPPAKPPQAAAAAPSGAPAKEPSPVQPSTQTSSLMAPPSMSALPLTEAELVPIEGSKPWPVMALPAIETPRTSASLPSPSVLAAPVLAPPAGLSPTMLSSPGAYSNPPSPKLNVLAPPNTTQRPSLLSLPPSTPKLASSAAPTGLSAPTDFPLQAPPKPPTAGVVPTTPSLTKSNPSSNQQPTQPQNSSTDKESSKPAVDAEDSSEKPAEGQNGGTNIATRNAIILQNFDESIIKDKVVQTQILFGRKMSRLQSTFIYIFFLLGSLLSLASPILRSHC